MAFPIFEGGYFSITNMSFSPKVAIPGEKVNFSITIKNTSGVKVSSCYIRYEITYPTIYDTYPALDNSAYLHGKPDYQMASNSWAANSSKTFTGSFVYSASDMDVSEYVLPRVYFQLSIVTSSTFSDGGNHDYAYYPVAGTTLTSQGLFTVLNKRDNPSLVFDAVRYPDNEAQALAADIKLNCDVEDDVFLAHGYTASLYRRVDESGNVDEPATLACTLEQMLAGVADDPTVITDEYSNGNDWLLTLIVSNGHETASAVVSVAKDFANLHLSGARTGGACFGGFSTSTDGDPKLESYYPAHLYSSANVDGDFTYKNMRQGYFAGDSITILANQVMPGYVSSSTTSVWFTVSLGQPIYASNISMSGTVILRGISGYLNSASAGVKVGASGYTFGLVQWVKKTGQITIRITKSSAFSNVTNNTPVMVASDGTFKITFT